MTTSEGLTQTTGLDKRPCAVDPCGRPATWLGANLPCLCTRNVYMCSQHRRQIDAIALLITQPLFCTVCNELTTGTDWSPVA